MPWSDFRLRVALRVLLLACCLAAFFYMALRSPMRLPAAVALVAAGVVLAELFYFVTITNRKLTRFLESVKYQDFLIQFTADNRLGRSFRDLNVRFNEVLEAFRTARSEIEENRLYLAAVVQQVHTGILSYNGAGTVHLINPNAKRFLGVSVLKNIHDLQPLDPGLYQVLMHLQTGKSSLYKSNAYQLTMQRTELWLRGQDVTLVTLQNIQPELQRQEMEAWQNLTRVLRHEIMNSLTPISSLTSTLRDILDQDLKFRQTHFEIGTEGAADLREGLNTIEGRSKGLIKFIDAYREYTSLPPLKPKKVYVKKLLDQAAQLMKPELLRAQVSLQVQCDAEHLTLQMDEELIEQVLINLLKNAIEALAGKPAATIALRGTYTGGHVIIEVEDNGPGIIREALEAIFVPFYTTKKTGSGIGLSLSRQIMHLHGGTLSAESEPDVRTVFRLRF